MRRTSTSLFALLSWLGLGLVCNPPLLAADAPEIADKLPLLPEAEALRVALGRDKELGALEAAIKKQEARTNYAGFSVKNPELRLQDISSKYAYADENKELQIGLRWRPPKLGELGLNEQRERVTLFEKRAKARAYRLKLVTEIQKTYAELALEQEFLELATREVAFEEQRSAAIERLIGLGQRPVLDQLKAHKRLVKARSRLNRTRQRRADTLARLGTYTGMSTEVAASPLDPPVMELDFEKLHALALARREDVRLTSQKLRLDDLRYRTERYELVPWFSYFEVAYHYESLKRDWVELLMGLRLPLFNWNLGEIRATAIKGEEREEIQGATVESIDRELAVALSRYRQARVEWQSLETDAKTFLPKSEHLLTEARQRNTLPVDEVLDFELSNLEFRRLMLEARHDLTRSGIELCRVVGVEHLEELGK